eukprot:TRINITY_DN18810_c0_g1::TRINITY_DN18810_c0_g1_i1::g.15150::m.15150 TRINITY_DN18810_c0_g1::TRINITY_DN18810_c0_g1_i1::g.15150  ORF type:complete len:510 (+),score=54.54,sp/Q9FIQ0/AGD9_ARATH/40.38/2e-43,ArfGap/PF01412.13/8.5e-31 TRINITY_DN18810_c0_g1_i1:95-1531(+)
MAPHDNNPQAPLILRTLRSRRENKICFDCNTANPSWASIPFGVYICLDCSARHRNMGVHITFVRSTELDTWTDMQLLHMIHGGNGTAQTYFKQHGFQDASGKLETKYTHRVGLMYKEHLQRLCESHQGPIFPELEEVQPAVSQPLASVPMPSATPVPVPMPAPATAAPIPVLTMAPLPQPSGPTPSEELLSTSPDKKPAYTSKMTTTKKPLKKKAGGLGAIKSDSGPFVAVEDAPLPTSTNTSLPASSSATAAPPSAWATTSDAASANKAPAPSAPRTSAMESSNNSNDPWAAAAQQSTLIHSSSLLSDAYKASLPKSQREESKASNDDSLYASFLGTGSSSNTSNPRPAQNNNPWATSSTTSTTASRPAEPSQEDNERLKKFSGAKAISSNQYFGQDGNSDNRGGNSSNYSGSGGSSAQYDKEDPVERLANMSFDGDIFDTARKLRSAADTFFQDLQDKYGNEGQAPSRRTHGGGGM